MRLFDGIVVTLTAAAADRVIAAEARLREAGAIVLSAGAEPVTERIDRVEPRDMLDSLDPLAEPTLPRALAAWLVSWSTDGLSRIAMLLAKAIARGRARGSARERPAVRARDGP